MKKLSTILITLLLALTIAMSLPVQVFADSTTEKYISEIKIGVDKKADKALAALEGYEILKGDDGKPVDLNKDAGGGVGSKGNRVVYLGFKRTGDRSEAVTDLAVMNMNGGYRTKDYEVLMEKQMKEQILPFVNVFLAAIEEYRENYTSGNPSNKARAEYIHDMLNEMKDDDCGGAGLGDLLLNETKFEMGDAAYEALSDSEKNQHADLVTIVAQANGKAVLLLSNLITRAADTNDNTWIDRFLSVSYDDMADETGLSPSKAKRELDRLYYDDAQKILASWDTLREQLLSAEEDASELDDAEAPDPTEAEEKMQDAQKDLDDEKVQDAIGAYLDNSVTLWDIADKINNIAAHDYLASVEYEDGTLLDFFTQTAEEIEENDISALYPMVAAFTEGQKAGLEFISLRELILIGATDEKGYKTQSTDAFTGGSIYAGVDREIFEPGGIALTSDAIRTEMALDTENNTADSPLHWYNYALMALTGVSVLGVAGSFAAYSFMGRTLSYTQNLLNTQFQIGSKEMVSYCKKLWVNYNQLVDAKIAEIQQATKAPVSPNQVDKLYNDYVKKTFFEEKGIAENKVAQLESGRTLSKWIGVGMSVAVVVLTAVTVWLTIRDLKNYYKVDFSPMPRYIVDEKDLIVYNAKGERIIVNNTAVYYKAVKCNRTEDAEYYKVLGEYGDLNGDVGRQWLGLYAERNPASAPILANSFKVSDQEQIPAGYELGIHTFGSAAAENLNNPLYVWKSDAPKVYVYFKTDSAANNGAAVTGSGFTGGTLALTGFSGLALGALSAILCMTLFKKRKETVRI